VSKLATINKDPPLAVQSWTECIYHRGSSSTACRWATWLSFRCPVRAAPVRAAEQRKPHHV